MNNRPITATDPLGEEEYDDHGDLVTNTRLVNGKYFGKSGEDKRSLKERIEDFVQESKGLGIFNAIDFYKYALGLPIWEMKNGKKVVTNDGPGVWGSVLTNEAAIYQTGCIGLQRLRLGSSGYNKSFYFYTDIKDAIRKATAEGSDARIFALQYMGITDYKKIPEKGFPSRVTPPSSTHPDGNHAVWHQIGPGKGYW